MKQFSITSRQFLYKIFGDKFIDREKLESDIEQERLEKLRKEREQLERQRKEREQLERQRLERERLERLRLQRLRLEKERQERERQNRIINEKYEQIKNDIPNLFTLDNNTLEKIKNSDNEQCIICLEEFKNGNQCLYLNCLHLFHSHCIIAWLTKHNTCPICKENYKLDDNKLNNFLKSGINNNKIQNNDNTQNNNEIEAHNNNENTTIINNNVINLIIQQNDTNRYRYGRGYNNPRRNQWGYRRDNHYRGRGYHARNNHRGNW